MVALNKAASNYMRAACLAVGGYDFLITMPAEWRMYTHQSGFRVANTLFWLVRYTSLATILVDSYLWFHSGISIAECNRIFFLPTIFKDFQMMASHAIMGWRTCNISQRRKPIVWLVSLSYVVVCVVEWVTSLYHGEPFHREKNCQLISRDTEPLGWLFYLSALVYDFIMVLISFWFLLRIKSRSKLLLRLRRMMLVDGLGYFILLAAINIINIIIYLTNDKDEGTSGVPIGYTLTWIMSQRILIRLNETSRRQRRDDMIAENVTQVLTRHTPLSADLVEEVSRKIRTKLNYEPFADGSSEHESDYHSNQSSIHGDPRKGKQAVRKVASDESEPYLDSVIDIEVDAGVSDKPTTIISGSRNENQGGSRDRSDLKYHRVNINDTGR